MTTGGIFAIVFGVIIVVLVLRAVRGGGRSSSGNGGFGHSGDGDGGGGDGGGGD